MNQIDKNDLSITSWNMECIFNCAGLYLHKLMDSSDIIVLNKHGLYNCELYKSIGFHEHFDGFGKASNRLNDTLHGKIMGHGGCAILWRKAINSKIETMPHLGNDRICVLKINSGNDECMLLIR